MEPIAELLRLPTAYGTPKKPLEWAAVRERLETPLNYWLATVRSDGSPHTVPSDGIWLDATWYFGGAPDTHHMRNVERDPRASMHIGDGTWAVIVEGICRFTVPDQERARRIADAGKKYGPLGYAPTPESYRDGAWGLEADRVLAWTQFPIDATRFRFPARSP